MYIRYAIARFIRKADPLITRFTIQDFLRAAPDVRTRTLPGRRGVEFTDSDCAAAEYAQGPANGNACLLHIQ